MGLSAAGIATFAMGFDAALIADAGEETPGMNVPA